jgi:hypothetical protein
MSGTEKVYEKNKKFREDVVLATTGSLYRTIPLNQGPSGSQCKKGNMHFYLFTACLQEI